MTGPGPAEVTAPPYEPARMMHWILDALGWGGWAALGGVAMLGPRAVLDALAGPGFDADRSMYENPDVDDITTGTWEIAHRAGLSEESTRGHLRTLRALGLIDWSGPLAHASVFRVRLDALWTLAADACDMTLNALDTPASGNAEYGGQS